MRIDTYTLYVVKINAPMNVIIYLDMRELPVIIYITMIYLGLLIIKTTLYYYKLI